MMSVILAHTSGSSKVKPRPDEYCHDLLSNIENIVIVFDSKSPTQATGSRSLITASSGVYI